VYPLIVTVQQLSKNVAMAMNTHTAIEEFLDVLSSMQSALHEKKVGG
jgi:hypothetical protein